MPRTTPTKVTQSAKDKKATKLKLKPKKLAPRISSDIQEKDTSLSNTRPISLPPPSTLTDSNTSPTVPTTIDTRTLVSNSLRPLRSLRMKPTYNEPTDSETTNPLVNSEINKQNTRNMMHSNMGSQDTNNGIWRTQVAAPTREIVYRKIVEILRALKPMAPPKVVEKLPGLACRMEETLLQLASNEAEYADVSTLPQRLNTIQQINARRLLRQQQAQSLKYFNQLRTSTNTSPQHENLKIAFKNMASNSIEETHACLVFQCLQSWRHHLVSAHGLAPWEIFPNKGLAAAAIVLPSTLEELKECFPSLERSERNDYFASLLLQEIQKICNYLNLQKQSESSAASPSSMPNANTPDGNVTTVHLYNNAGWKRILQTGNSTNSDNTVKKRKTNIVSSSPVYNTNLHGISPSLGPQQSPSDALNQRLYSQHMQTDTQNQLPALLPTTSVSYFRQSPHGSSMNSSNNNQEMEGDNRIQLLARGVNHINQQNMPHENQTVSNDINEQQLQELRWKLQEAEREKARLAEETLRLRQQLQLQIQQAKQANDNK